MEEDNVVKINKATQNTKLNTLTGDEQAFFREAYRIIAKNKVLNKMSPKRKFSWAQGFANGVSYAKELLNE